MAAAPLLLAAALSVASVTGKWDASLLPTPDEPVAFGLEISRKGEGLEAFLVNGQARTPFTAATWDGGALVLSLAHYDATITARLAGTKLEGTYERTTAEGKAVVPFAAVRPAKHAAVPKPARSVEGSWGFELERDRATGFFRQKGSEVEGTLLTTTGDYGALHGTFDGTNLVLSVFDGVHVYRFDGTLEEPDLLTGEFRSRTNPPVLFRARRLAGTEAERFLPDAFAIVRAKDPAAPFRFAFPDEAGRNVTSEDFAGRPMIVTIMGTWCPNCGDEAPLLALLAKEHAARGLAVVELAFEYTDDAARFRRQAARYRERYRVDVPILLAGTTGEAAASPVVARLDGWSGYPTTLFLDRSHRVVAVCSGFEGPATGDRYARMQRAFEERVKELLE